MINARHGPLKTAQRGTRRGGAAILAAAAAYARVKELQQLTQHPLGLGVLRVDLWL